MSAPVLTKTDDLSRPEWLNARRKGIGGSDAAAILGLDPFKTPLAVYLDKRGELPDDDAGEAAEWGNRLEPMVAAAVTERVNAQRADEGKPPVVVRRRKAILQHPSRDWMLANIDREILKHEDGPAVMECKTTGYWMARQWEDEGDTLPDRYHVQTQHYLAVTGRRHALIAVLIAGQRLVFEWVQRDEALIGALLEVEEAFWQRVVEGNPPPAMADDKERVKALYPHAPEGSTVVLPREAADLLREFNAAKAAAKAVKERVDRCEARVRQLIGDAEAAFLPGTDTPAITCKEVDRKAYSVAATTYRRLNVAKGV